MAAAVGVTLALAGCGQDGSDTAGSGDASTGSVTIGLIAPMEGGFADIGNNIVNGFKLGVQHAKEDGLAEGIDVGVEVKDEQANAEAASQAARDFLSDDVQLLAGMLTTPACSAVAPLVEEAGGVLVTSVCAGNNLSGALTGEIPFERTFSMSPRDAMVSRALATALSDKFPDVSSYNVFGYDYAWGRDTWSTYRDAMKGSGVDVETNQEFWVPLGETNFRTQVSALSRGVGDKATSAVFLATYGAGTSAFLQQASAFDVVGNVDLLASAGGYYPVARQLDGAAPDMWNAYDYNYAAYDNKTNTRFVEDFEAAHGQKPVSWSYEGYQAALAYMTAIDEVGGADADQIVEALSDVEFDSPSGIVSIDPETHQLMAPIVVSHTRGKADAPEGVEVIETVVVPAADVLDAS
jgi:branched-chain amino acid transport system substrate-binding protein